MRFFGAMLVAAATSASAVPPQEAADWSADLHFLATQMERTHKDFYHSVTPEEFAAQVDSLDAQLPNLERHEILVRMARIVASVGDGHTNIYPTRDSMIGFHTLPISLTFFGDGLYIRAVRGSDPHLLGAEVKQIGDHRVVDAYRICLRHDRP